MKITPLRFVGGALLAALLPALSGCSWLLGEDNEYQRAYSVKALEVPPDLELPPKDTTMELPPTASQQGDTSRVAVAARGGVLPDASGFRLRSSGERSWLEVETEPDAVWEGVRRFLRANSIPVERGDAKLGLVETGWVEVKVEPDNAVDRFFDTVLGWFSGSGLRERYRIQLVRGEVPGTTLVQVTHYLQEEVLLGSADSTEGTTWVTRPSDPARETEMLGRIMRYLSGVRGPGGVGARLVVDDQDQPRIELETGRDVAWTRLGEALEELGIDVEGKDAGAGYYDIAYAFEDAAEGFLHKLFFWLDERAGEAVPFRLQVEERGEGAAVRLLDRSGASVAAAQARHVLERLLPALEGGG